MGNENWSKAVSFIKGNLVRICAGNSLGTGLAIPPFIKGEGNCCVLTANHVIEKARNSKEDIVIESEVTKRKIVVSHANRKIYWKKDRDQAIIVFSSDINICKRSRLTVIVYNSFCKLISWGKKMKGLQFHKRKG